MKWTGTIALATIMLVAGPCRTPSVAAISAQSAGRPSQASNASSTPTDISARRYVRRHQRYARSGYHDHRYGYRPYYPRYYARPSYYEPSPYYAPAPFPFAFGFGFGPWW